MSTDTDIINVAPPTELLASASLPNTFPSLVTPDNQRTPSTTFTFSPDDGVFGDEIKKLIDNKMYANKEEHKREKRVLDYTISGLQDEIDEKDKELLMKDGEIRNSNRRNEKDRDEHRKSENEMDKEIAQLEQTVDGLEKDLAAANVETQKTKQELNDAKKKYTELDQKSNKKLNTMQTTHEGNIQELMVRNEKLEQDVVKEKATSQQNCDILVLQVSGLEVKVGFAERDVSKANTERDNAIKDHRKDNMELSGQISVVQSRVVTLEGDLATMGAEKEGLAKEKEQLRVKLEAKEEEYNTTVASTTASNDKAIALKEETIKNERAEKEAIAKEKEQLEVELKAKEEDYNTAVASHENELTAKGEEVTQLQVVVAQLRLEKQKLVVVKEEQQEEAIEQSQIQHARQRKKEIMNKSSSSRKNEHDTVVTVTVPVGLPLTTIVSYLAPRDVLNCIQTCKEWKNTIDKDGVWREVAKAVSPDGVDAMTQQEEENKNKPHGSMLPEVNFRNMAIALSRRSSDYIFPAVFEYPQAKLQLTDVLVVIEFRYRNKRVGALCSDFTDLTEEQPGTRKSIKFDGRNAFNKNPLSSIILEYDDEDKQDGNFEGTMRLVRRDTGKSFCINDYRPINPYNCGSLPEKSLYLEIDIDDDPFLTPDAPNLSGIIARGLGHQLDYKSISFDLDIMVDMIDGSEDKIRYCELKLSVQAGENYDEDTVFESMNHFLLFLEGFDWK